MKSQFIKNLLQSTVLLVVCLFHSACIDTYGVRQIEGEKIKLEADKRRVEREIESLTKKIEANTERVAKAKELQSSVDAAILSKSESQKAVEKLEQEYLAKLSMLRACEKSFRTKIPIKAGDSFEKLTLPSGRIFEGVTVREIKDAGFSIAHSAGFTNIPFSEMPESFTSQFVMPPPAVMTGIDPLDVFGKKPDSLMGDEERRRLTDMARNLEQEAAENERKERQLALESEQAERDAKRAAEDAMRAKAEQERTKIRKRQDEIDAQITQLNARISQLNSGKSDLQRRWSSSRIKQNQTDQAKMLGEYDSKIKALNETIAALRTQRSQLN